jgi:cytoskeletal protein CcmA (bactofilin family)
MRRVEGKLLGPVVFREDTSFHGMIDGDATAAAGVTVLVHGMIAGSLEVERDATVELRGMVAGPTVNRGRLVIYGVVRAPVHNEDAGATSYVNDRTRR